MRRRHPMSRSKDGDTGKIVTADEAVQLINDNDVVAFGGFVAIGFAENIAVALEKRFLGLPSGNGGEGADADNLRPEPGHPANLNLVFAAGQGDGDARGLNHLAHEGLVKRAIGGHWGLVPRLAKMAVDGQIEAWNLPQGVVCHMFRDIAAGKPGTLTRVGLGTFVDPRHGGGKLNSRSKMNFVKVMEIEGKEYLLYRSFPIHVGIIRGTTADPDGNITMEREALTLEAQAIAMAARNCGGVVIAQVERVAERGTLNARQVKIPGILVDCVVVAEKPEYHQQSFVEPYSPAFASEIKVPASSVPPMSMGVRKAIARRAARELRANDVVNLGIGVPEGVASVAAEERIIDLLTLTAEPGVIGGIPAGGLNFGAATNAQAIIDQPNQFDFYDGGGLDIAVLGLAQADREGNVNVSRFGTRLAGAGGFINISQNARTVVFVGTLTTGKNQPTIVDGRVHVGEDTGGIKFVEQVEHRTFSGHQALANGQRVLYVTERGVFALVEDGIQLIEVAPGVDIEKDIVARMAFRPIIDGDPVGMDSLIFADGLMNLRGRLLGTPLEDRMHFDPAQDRFFVNFEDLQVRTPEDIERVRRALESKLRPIGHKVPGTVNYDRFSIGPELMDDYVAMVQRILEKYHTQVIRYTSNAFLRAELGEALERGDVIPNLFADRDEAETYVKAV